MPGVAAVKGYASVGLLTARIGGIYAIIADMNELAAHCRQGKIKNGKYNHPNL
jgi:hypothetical protein